MNAKDLTESLIEEAFEAHQSVQYKNIKVANGETGEELGFVSMVFLTRDDEEGEIVLLVHK